MNEQIKPKPEPISLSSLLTPSKTVEIDYPEFEGFTIRMWLDYCDEYNHPLTNCPKWGTKSFSMPNVSSGLKQEELNIIYNTFDLYVQYAICEGFGMPQVEAGSAGVPIASVDYSAMNDVVHKLNGYPIKVNQYFKELILDKLHDRDQATSSLYLFMNRLMSLPMVYATPDANGQYTGSYFKKQQENFGIPPARKDLHIITFNNAHGTNKDIQTELRHDGTWMAVSGDIKHTTQALRHFGSISISPGSLVGVPNVDRGLVNHFVSTQATTHTNFNPNVFYSTVGGPNFDDYINETGWTNSYDGGEISYFHWMGNNPILEYDNKRYAKQIYRPTWGAGGAAKVTGSGALNDLPRISSWTISKLEKRKNVIMADINKPAHLFEGTGNSGFVVIPENLHPTIKNNMDYYLRKANIRDRGPRRKNLFAKRPRIIRRRRIRKPNFLNPFRFIRRKFRRFRWL